MSIRCNTLRRALLSGLLGTAMTAAHEVQAQQFVSVDERPELDQTNDSASGRVDIRAVPNRFLRVRGKINGEGDIDLWAFDVARGAQVILVSANASRILWIADRNRNRRIDAADRSFLVTRGNERHTFTQRNSVQMLAVVSGEPNELYSIVVHKLNKSTRGITATFIGANALDRFDGRAHANRADFRAKVSMPDPDLRSGSVSRSKTIINDDVPTFDLRLSRFVDTSTRSVPISLHLFEIDHAGEDEVTDISPHDSSRSLDIVYDAFSRVVRDSSGRRLGDVGEIITLRGTDKRRARVSFRVDSKEPVPVPSSRQLATSN